MIIGLSLSRKKRNPCALAVAPGRSIAEATTASVYCGWPCDVEVFEERRAGAQVGLGARRQPELLIDALLFDRNSLNNHMAFQGELFRRSPRLLLGWLDTCNSIQ
jgi:hypothetical protein